MKTSVALCTYNGEKYINEQLDSILNQSTSVDEIIVCDDKSSDKTVLILKEYQSLYPHLIKIYINEENLKSVKNFENAISLCSNDIIFLSDQDDVWDSKKVEIILEQFKQNPSLNVISTNGCSYDGITKDCVRLSVWDIPNFLKQEKKEINYFEIISSITNIATGATMAIRKDYKKQIFPIPLYKDFHHDEWIALNASFDKSFFFLDEKLISYRIHEEQQVGENFFKLKTQDLITFTSLYRKSEFRDYKKILKKISSNYLKKVDIIKNCNINNQSKEILTEAIAIDRKNFNKVKNSIKKLYPVSYWVLYFSDLISQKRKLS